MPAVGWGSWLIPVMIQVCAPSLEWKRTSRPSGEMRKNKVAQHRASGSRSACLSVKRTNMVYLGSCAAQTAPICVTHLLRRSDSLNTRVKGEASVWKWIFTRPKPWIVQFMRGDTGPPLKSVFTKLTVNEEEADLKINIRVSLQILSFVFLWLGF